MKIYDISQEVFSSVVFPGDPAPQKQTLCSMQDGSLYNLTAFSMCAHNGTHVDAPYHFISDGKTVDALLPEATVGYAYVCHHDGVLYGSGAETICHRARSICQEASRRILLGGSTVVSEEAARVFAEQGVLLVGNESQTVGPPDAPMAVHKILLGQDIVLLEGIRLENVPDGVYLLSAAPLKLAGADGAPTRAMLIDLSDR